MENVAHSFYSKSGLMRQCAREMHLEENRCQDCIEGNTMKITPHYIFIHNVWVPISHSHVLRGGNEGRIHTDMYFPYSHRYP